MKLRYLGLGLIAIGLLAVGWALGQPGVAKPVPERGQYVVTGTGEGAILVEGRTGHTWVLTFANDGRAVWLPAQRIDNPDLAAEWRRVNDRGRGEKDRRKGKAEEK